jgi:hypothetical protein
MKLIVEVNQQGFGTVRPAEEEGGAQAGGQPPATGTPEGFVFLPATGNTLPLPEPPHPSGDPKRSEMFGGYLDRVATAAHAEEFQRQQIGSLFGGAAAALFQRFGGFDHNNRANWPQAADYFYNEPAYWTADERRANAAARAAWEARDARRRAEGSK